MFFSRIFFATFLVFNPFEIYSNDWVKIKEEDLTLNKRKTRPITGLSTELAPQLKYPKIPSLPTSIDTDIRETFLFNLAHSTNSNPLAFIQVIHDDYLDPEEEKGKRIPLQDITYVVEPSKDGLVEIVYSSSNIQMSALTVFDISNQNLKEDYIEQVLYSLDASNLTELNISHNSFGENSLRAVAYLLLKSKKLQKLDISCHGKDINCLLSKRYKGKPWSQLMQEAFEINQSLTYLNIQDNVLFNGGLIKTIFSNLPALHTLNISGQIIRYLGDNFFNTLPPHPSLKILDLSDMELTDQHTDKIAYFLKTHTSLSKVNLSRNPLSQKSQTTLKNLANDINPTLDLVFENMGPHS